LISRVTLFSLLLSIFLTAGIRMATEAQRDGCTPYLSGDTKAASSEWVDSGTSQISVPCNDWIMRQTLRVQLLCLLDGALIAVFVLNALSDLRDWLQMRRRLRGSNG
jgi:hypothetical protein